eukprot:5481891-Lingulodinium_polyedra.AAC.1
MTTIAAKLLPTDLQEAVRGPGVRVCCRRSGSILADGVAHSQPQLQIPGPCNGVPELFGFLAERHSRL